MFRLRVAHCGLRKIGWAAVLIAVTMTFATAQQSPSVTPVPSPSPARSVRIDFVPPPLEGTISLGIYDRDGKLVRVLHQEAELDEFTVEADGLETKWDGKNDDGELLPAGKYRARGYVVGRSKMEDLGPITTALPIEVPDDVSIKLVPNRLSKAAKTILDLAVECDDENCFLKTTDGLPLITISDNANFTRVYLLKNDEKSVDVFVDDGDSVDQFRVSNLDQMMAFDCGEIGLK
jgi:hypothetical protein